MQDGKVDPRIGVEVRLERMIADGATIEQVAEVWASVMALPGPDFSRMNAAIKRRWPKGLEKIKSMAWDIRNKR